jgi:hypothetical protein
MGWWRGENRLIPRAAEPRKAVILAFVFKAWGEIQGS